MRKLTVSRDREGDNRRPAPANPDRGGGIGAWLSLAAVVVLAQSATPAHAQSTAADGASSIERQVSPRTLSRLLLIAATNAGKRFVAVGEHGYVILMSVGQEAVLTVLAREQAKLGLIFLDMGRAVKELATLV